MSDQTWPKVRTRSVKVKGRPYTYYTVDLGMVDGRRRTKTFKSKNAAETWARRKRVERNKLGYDAARLSDEQKKDAVRAIQALEGRASLQRAAEFFVSHAGPETVKRTVTETIKSYLDEATADNLRQASIDSLRYRLARFEETFGDQLVSDVDRTDVQTWLKDLAQRNGRPLSPLSKRHYRTVIGGLFNFAIENDYAAVNPLAKKSPRRSRAKGADDEKLPEIISLKEVRRLMAAAEEHIPEMVPPLAVGFFAGLRTAELTKLEWKDVDLDTKTITVRPSIAKGRSVRHVDIQDNLLLWLAPHRKKTGTVWSSELSWDHCFKQVRRRAGLTEWPRNAMRHCFASHHLIKFQNENATALQLGHRSAHILYNHYRALVKREEANAYWKIVPGKMGKSTIVFPATAG